MKTQATSTTMTTENNNYSLGFNRWMGLSKKAKANLFTYIYLVEGLKDLKAVHSREKELLAELSEANYKSLKKGQYLSN